MDTKNNLIFKSFENTKKNKNENILNIFLNEIDENNHFEITQNVLSKINKL